MNRIEKRFQALENDDKAALVCYLTAGDPSIELTEDIVFTLEKSGADIIELGIPFSDPMADGPTIQLASERALKNDINLEDVLNTVSNIREKSNIPIILFGYYNPFLAYGLEKFSKDAKKAGADGVLVVDLPPEESVEFKKYLDDNGLNLIFLLAPTSTKERIDLVSKYASGFIYLVSVTGVTGARPDLDYSLENLTSDIKKKSNLPVGVGFGVSSTEQAVKISGFSDAVIVGSAIVRIIENNSNNQKAMLGELSDFVSELSDACYRQ
ncbi:MAG: tryptophan synthase subunit alpha [Candidatus Dadabacteria bacterium]|nr:tryptophan synthase subunit alpha [Candidatus Dadabacteria bacterium]NIQ14418.1 tryptophan synthase subunit alpha [Candidatus Dadabacteria bacterium]